MRARETAIRFVHRIVPEKQPEQVYDPHTLAAAGYEVRPKETQAETIKRLEQQEEDYDTFLQAQAWGGER